MSYISDFVPALEVNDTGIWRGGLSVVGEYSSDFTMVSVPNVIIIQGNADEGMLPKLSALIGARMAQRSGNFLHNFGLI